jgi:hypothetical protein
MLTTKRKPASVGEILVEEFIASMGLTQGALAEAMGVQRKHVNEHSAARSHFRFPADRRTTWHQPFFANMTFAAEAAASAE